MIDVLELLWYDDIVMFKKLSPRTWLRNSSHYEGMNICKKKYVLGNLYYF